jgi:hypothetical protein
MRFGVFHYIYFCSITPNVRFCVICLCYALACSVHKKAIDSTCLNSPLEMRNWHIVDIACQTPKPFPIWLRKMEPQCFVYYTHVPFLLTDKTRNLLWYVCSRGPLRPNLPHGPPTPFPFSAHPPTPSAASPVSPVGRGLPAGGADR